MAAIGRRGRRMDGDAAQVGRSDGFVQCPNCLTVFRIAWRQLTAANGAVCCGLCGSVFDAQATFYPALPAAVAQVTEAMDESVAACTRATPRPAPRAAIAASTQPPIDLAADAREPDATPHERLPWAWCGLCFALAVIALAQLLWFNRFSLARQPGWAVPVRVACAYLPCDLPLARLPDALQVTRRQLQPHPYRPRGLLLTATFSNVAENPQPWPQLGVTLYALNGTTLGSRWIAPRDYRPASSPGDRPMAPNTEYAVRLSLQAPAQPVAGFEIRFR